MNLKIVRKEHHQANKAVGTENMPGITPETPHKVLKKITRVKLRRLELLALKYEKVELKRSFDVFREILINYNTKKLKNSKNPMVLVQDMRYPKASFDTKK